MNVTSTEWIIIGACGGVIVALIDVVWRLLNKRLDAQDEVNAEKFNAHAKDIGKHYSEINDLHLYVKELQTNMTNHNTNFNEMKTAVNLFREEMVKTLRRLEDKLDDFRERRT